MSSNAEYHADRSRLSNSNLSRMKESPRDFYNEHFLGAYSPATPAMIFGSMVHTWVLEVEKFTEEYIVAPKVDRRTKEGKEVWASFEASKGERVLVSEDDVNTVIECARAVYSQEDFAPYYKVKHQCEIEQRIDFEFAGEQCRCKPDLVHVESGIAWDIKTTDDASPEGFAKSVINFGYHRQAAFYLHALREKHGKDFRFIFLAVEKKAPHYCAAHELDAEFLARGYYELESLIAEYRYRVANDDWEPQYTKGVNIVAAPKWYRSGIYELGGAA